MLNGKCECCNEKKILLEHEMIDEMNGGSFNKIIKICYYCYYVFLAYETKLSELEDAKFYMKVYQKLVIKNESINNSEIYKKLINMSYYESLKMIAIARIHKYNIYSRGREYINSEVGINNWNYLNFRSELKMNVEFNHLTSNNSILNSNLTSKIIHDDLFNTMITYVEDDNEIVYQKMFKDIEINVKNKRNNHRNYADKLRPLILFMG